MWGGINSRITDPAGLWPWAETNQGLLSVAALVLALGIAVFEVRRAAWATSRQLAEYVDFVLRLADRSLELTHDAIETLDGKRPETDRVSLIVWSGLQQSLQASLQELQTVRPQHASLAFSVNMLERALTTKLVDEAEQALRREALASHLGTIEALRERIATFQPRSRWF